MTGFSNYDLDDSRVLLDNAPNEIQVIADGYNVLVEQVADHTVELERNVIEKEVLLKEVHHRVTNNLQFIVSILNMQLRNTDSPDAQDVLRRVQDRVMSLANIHRLLYTDTQVDSVRADLPLSMIVGSILKLDTDRGAVETGVSLVPGALDPDLAVPLPLLLTKALTNATKYLGGGKPPISVRLVESDIARIELAEAS